MFETIQNILGPILTAIGGFIVAKAGLAAIVYAIFKLLSEKWLNAVEPLAVRVREHGN